MAVTIHPALVFVAGVVFGSAFTVLVIFSLAFRDARKGS